MNKFNQNFFQVLYPFFPIWAWFCLKFLHFPAEKILVFMLLPSISYIIWTMRVRFPAYLVFFSLFTVFHLWTIFYYDLLPSNTNWFNFFFSDYNVLALALFFVVENSNFEDDFIQRMNKFTLGIILVSLLVSIIQIKVPTFFFNNDSETNDWDSIYMEDQRNASIYSWVSMNSVGVTFPFILAIMISVYEIRSKAFPLIALSGVVVSFLTRARYVMISAIIAFSQLFIGKRIRATTKFYLIIGFIAGLALIIGAANVAGFDIQAVINERILEKDSDMGSAKARILSYEVFLKKFPEHPYIGVGPKTRDDVVDLLGGEAPIIHVGYLSYLYYYGIFGASLLFICLILLVYDSWIVGKRYGFWGSFYGFTGFILANATFVYFNMSEMGIVMGLIYMRYYKLRYERLYELNSENPDEEEGQFPGKITTPIQIA